MEAVAVVILAPFLVLLLIAWLYDLIWRAWINFDASRKAKRASRLNKQFLAEGMRPSKADYEADRIAYGREKRRTQRDKTGGADKK